MTGLIFQTLNRKHTIIPIQVRQEIIHKALAWGRTHSHLALLENNGLLYPSSPFPNLLAAGILEEVNFTPGQSFNQLQEWHDEHKDWLFGYLAYDLKNETENLSSQNPDRHRLPNIRFFRPRHVMQFHRDGIEIWSVDDPGEIIHDILRTAHLEETPLAKPLKLNKGMEKEEYLRKAEAIRQHIKDGDCYEMNLCMEFWANEAELNPYSAYRQLSRLSPMPFAAFLKLEKNYLIAASPERFLKKEGNHIISQPIKGTAPRGKTSHEDLVLKEQLRHSEKEMAENMMIVDLVRNDLARTAIPGSVKVNGLFDVYTFRNVHQMVSTVSSRTKSGTPFTQPLKNAFPMGSMTGAPKIKVMELIEQYENSKRGLYSGAVGYISPEGNFDFNVVIRSLIYSAGTRTLSFQVGSAITYDAVPEQEYEECLLKATAMRQLLNLEKNPLTQPVTEPHMQPHMSEDHSNQTPDFSTASTA